MNLGVVMACVLADSDLIKPGASPITTSERYRNRISFIFNIGVATMKIAKGSV